MIKHSALLAAAAAMALSSPAWTKDGKTSRKEESIGVGSGLAVGAMAGGPVGAVIGAAVGAWTGDRFGRERRRREAAEERYASASTDNEALEALLEGNERKLGDLRASLSTERLHFRDALERALEIDVFFHTGDTALDDDTRERLMRVGEVVRELDDFSIAIEGHADARGDADYNEQLSAERAAAVREALVGAGVDERRITARAAGETMSTAAENDLDALALERRVSLSLTQPQSSNRVARK
jgi:outer membrane protein OmpA-like peptidoglycan-associated protein